MATHLVMGDPHCTPKANNDRFLWAGKMARDLKPTTIVCMGDFASMDSLSSYDKGKKSFEGRRYKKVVWGSDVAILIIPRATVEQSSYCSVDILALLSIIIPQVKPFSHGVTKTFIEFNTSNFLSFVIYTNTF